MLVELDPLSREAQRWGQDLAERKRSETFVRNQQAAQVSRHRDRPLAHVKDLGRARELDRDRIEARFRLALAPRSGRIDEEVEEHRATVPRPRQQEATAAQAGQRRLGDHRGEAAGDHGVEGVASGLQHLARGLGHPLVTRRDRGPNLPTLHVPRMRPTSGRGKFSPYFLSAGAET